MTPLDEAHASAIRCAFWLLVAIVVSVVGSFYFARWIVS